MAATSNLTYKNELNKSLSSKAENTKIHPQSLNTADATSTIPKQLKGILKKKHTKKIKIKFSETATVAKIKQSLNIVTDDHQKCIDLEVRKIHGAELNQSELTKLENCKTQYPMLAENITTINRETEAENINKKYPYDVQEYHTVAKYYKKKLINQYSNKQYSELTSNERQAVQKQYNNQTKLGIQETYDQNEFTLNYMIDVYNNFQKENSHSTEINLMKKKEPDSKPDFNNLSTDELKLVIWFFRYKSGTKPHTTKSFKDLDFLTLILLNKKNFIGVNLIDIQFFYTIFKKLTQDEQTQILEYLKTNNKLKDNNDIQNNLYELFSNYENIKIFKPTLLLVQNAEIKKIITYVKSFFNKIDFSANDFIELCINTMIKANPFYSSIPYVLERLFNIYSMYYTILIIWNFFDMDNEYRKPLKDDIYKTNIDNIRFDIPDETIFTRIEKSEKLIFIAKQLFKFFVLLKQNNNIYDIYTSQNIIDNLSKYNLFDSENIQDSNYLKYNNLAQIIICLSILCILIKNDELGNLLGNNGIVNESIKGCYDFLLSKFNKLILHNFYELLSEYINDRGLFIPGDSNIKNIINNTIGSILGELLCKDIELEQQKLSKVIFVDTQ